MYRGFDQHIFYPYFVGGFDYIQLIADMLHTHGRFDGPVFGDLFDLVLIVIVAGRKKRENSHGNQIKNSFVHAL